MTKALTKAEKKQRKEERRKANQQKPPSPTVKTVVQPKRPNLEVNLCEGCAYEVGQCNGKPKFASDFDPNLKGAAADRVVECVGFLAIDDLPPDQGRTGEPAAPGPAAAEEKPKTGPRVCDIEHLGDFPDCFRDCPKDECDGVPDPAHAGDDQPSQDEPEGPYPPGANDGEENDEGASLEPEPPPQVVKSEAIERASLDRFATDKTDYGPCPSCDQPLKRTAYSRYVDAIRCTNGHCRAYRTIVRTVPTGAK